MTAPHCSPEEAVAEFNRRFPVGSEVMLKKDGVPESVRTKTRSEAFVMCGHSAVAFLEGVSGAYLISHVSETTAAPNSLLVQKVAKAMHSAGHAEGFFNFPWEKLAEHGREKYAVLAQAALAACEAEELASTLQANDALIRRIRLREAYWHNDAQVKHLLKQNRALLARLEAKP